MKRLFFVFAVGAALCGCQRSGFDPEPTPVKGLLLTSSETSYQEWFTAGDDLLRAPASRATESNFQALDSIGVFIYSGALGAGPYHSTNMIYYTKDGTPDGSTSPQWTAATAMGGALVAGTAYSSTAYYPYQKTATNASAVVHSVATDQRAAAVTGSAQAVERSDFMWAPPVAVSNPATAPEAKMLFQHLLTKLVVNLQVPSTIDGVAVSKLNSVAIKNLNTTASIHLGTGALSGLTNAKDIKPRQLSGNGNPGTVAVYEAVVVSQTAASGVVLVEVRCQTALGERVANYFPAASGLVLGSGKKITLTLTSAADIAITSELDLVTGQAYTDLPLKVKVATGTAWTLTAPAGSWITLATASGGTYGATISGTGTGIDQTVYVKTTANTGAGATPRQAVLTLAAKIAGVDRSVTYTAVQNYSQPVVGFPTTNLIMEALNAQLPAVSGNSNWYIKCSNMSPSMRLSRRNVPYDQQTAADTIALHALSTTGLKKGYMVSGNYYNSTGALYIITDLYTTPEVANFTCNGVAVAIDARSIKVANIRFARGNLVATGVRGPAALGGCRVGNLTDGGLYFMFGSLIGWKGGDKDGGGKGIGNLTLTENVFWGEATQWDWENNSYLWPINMPNVPQSWPLKLGVNKWLFGLATGWDTFGQNIRDYPGFKEGTLSVDGVGDPCTYYLGAEWRSMTYLDWYAITGVESTPLGYPYNVDLHALYRTVMPNVRGVWIGPAVTFPSTINTYASIFFPAAGTLSWLPSNTGYYSTSHAAMYNTTTTAAGNSAVFYNNMQGHQFLQGQTGAPRHNGVPVRCIRE